MKEPRINEEIRKMPQEPLLPVEKRLIGWSLGLGIALLAILVLTSRVVPGFGG